MYRFFTGKIHDNIVEDMKLSYRRSSEPNHGHHQELGWACWPKIITAKPIHC